MLFRRLGRAIVVLGIAASAACAFDPHGVGGGDPIDASVIDAPDSSPIDATDATPIDAIDAPLPIDACVPGPTGELCNGLDDDCDLNVDEAFPTVGDPCDGPDSDLCTDDALACNAAGTGTVCANATPDDDVERCNGADDDCDGPADEDFPTLTMPCDGPDGDACAEGTFGCTTDGSGVVCDDATTTTTEICNGADDDCDGPADEDFPTLMTPCDGADGDSCAEGAIERDPGSGLTRCGDTTDTIVETCNMADDDCDVSVDETFNLTGNPTNCGQCGRVCTNGFGTTTCAASTCMPTCSAGANDCDGNAITGCELRNTNPPCAGSTALGTVRGDNGTDTLTATGYAESFRRVQVTETVSGGGGDIDAEITLVSPPGTNFDLFVTCAACGGTTLSSTTTGIDTVNIGRGDDFGSQTYTIVIEVRWVSSSACGDWALAVNGNVDTANESCN